MIGYLVSKHMYLTEILHTPGRRQSKTSIQPTNVDQNSLETVFDCHLSHDWRHITIKTTVSIDF